MGGVRIAGHFRIDQRATHNICDMVDERVVNAAVRYVRYPVSTQLEQPKFGRANPAADGEARAVAKPCCPRGNDRRIRQAVNARQLL